MKEEWRKQKSTIRVFNRFTLPAQAGSPIILFQCEGMHGGMHAWIVGEGAPGMGVSLPGQVWAPGHLAPQ